jgi:hypothetical protein
LKRNEREREGSVLKKSEEREEKESVWGAKNYISGFAGSQAVPARPSGFW